MALRSRATVETCPVRLNVAELLRRVRVRQPDMWACWEAGDPALFRAMPKAFPGGEAAATLAMDLRRGRAKLSWRVPGGPPGEAAVELTALPCRTGLRWYWLCPASGRRCLWLYLPAGAAGFLSRQAHGLVHMSLMESRQDRAARKARKLRRRLGETPPTLGAAPPPPPPRMTAQRYLACIMAIHEAEVAAGVRT